MELSALSERYFLTETEQRALSCLLNALQAGNPKISIRAIAQKAGVSSTTVIKLSKKMGYQGYSDMLYSLRRYMAGESNSFVGVELSALLTPPVDSSLIDACAHDLYSHREQCVFVVAAGSATIAATYFVRRLSAVGIRAYDGSPVDIMRGLGRNTLTFCLSKSGEERSLIDTAARAHALGHKLYTFTTAAGSALDKVSETSFIIRANAVSPFDVPDFFIGRTILLFEHILSQLFILLRTEPPV